MDALVDSIMNCKFLTWNQDSQARMNSTVVLLATYNGMK